MDIALNLFALALLFYGLGKSADLVVDSIRAVGRRWNISIFFLGIILGFFTSFPELAVGLNALLKNVRDVSLGDLLGGILTLFGLILGLSAFFERGITTDGKRESILPIILYLLFPLILGIDGKITSLEGLLLVVGYILLLQKLRTHHPHTISAPSHLTTKKPHTIVILTLTGCALLIALSHLIMRITLSLAEKTAIPTFIIGTVLFSLGTNLPEIIVAIRSWKKRVYQLSIANLMGSAIANPCIIGIFAIIKPFSFKVDATYYLLLAFTIILLSFLSRFYETGKVITRKEGLALATTYGLFIMLQILLIGS